MQLACIAICIYMAYARVTLCFVFRAVSLAAAVWPALSGSQADPLSRGGNVVSFGPLACSQRLGGGVAEALRPLAVELLLGQPLFVATGVGPSPSLKEVQLAKSLRPVLRGRAPSPSELLRGLAPGGFLLVQERACK